ncbi:CoA transferase [Rhodococcus sp. 14C212]|uniref:CaiB/BaiF CoA transferase family protein n=1 Tax=Rhodococcus sp. 14C212 TaxID=2711209 RepID=UPI0013EAA048|nr:CoA transferase [Rhodococcus sp. 14C212]NGP07791.1 CoA transferase [Rhodococcus sp. 14C212]
MNNPTPLPGGVLGDIKVVELCHLIAGPYCGMLLADEGADVIKVEPPQGELTRSREPIRTTEQGAMSGYFASLNRRKRSITLDLKNESGSELLHRLLSDADVFITNMRGAALGRLGIHPAELQQRYPKLIIVSMSGFGLFDAGVDANRAGLAMVAEALSGTTGLTRDREGRPTWCGFALGDIVTGMTAHSSVLLGLRERERTGRGRLLDLSLTESTLPLATVALARVQSSDANLSKVAGANDFHGVPYGTFAASDGYYNIGVNRDDFWVRLCRAMGRPDLVDDPRYATYVERASRQREVEELLEAWSTQLTRQQVVDALTEVDVPVAPVLTMAEVLDNEHFAARGTFVEVDDAIGGTLLQPGDPTGFAVRTPARVPRLGEHRDSILAEIGMTDSQIEALADGGAFGPTRHVSATA